jgi:hypothetical protein
MGMQEVETSTPRISQNLKRSEEVRTRAHPKLSHSQITPIGLGFERLFTAPLLTDAGDDRFKAKLDLLRHQVQEHDLGAVETAAVDDVKNFQGEELNG